MIWSLFVFLSAQSNFWLFWKEYQPRHCSSVVLCTRGKVPSASSSCNVQGRRDGGAWTPDWRRPPKKETLVFQAPLLELLEANLKLTLPSPSKANSSPDQILLRRRCHCGKLFSPKSLSKPDKDKPAGTKCVRGGRSSSAGRTAPTSGLASLATSLKRSLGAKVGLLLVHSPPRTEPLGLGSLWWWIWFSLLKNPVKSTWKMVLSYSHLFHKYKIAYLFFSFFRFPRFEFPHKISSRFEVLIFSSTFSVFPQQSVFFQNALFPKRILRFASLFSFKRTKKLKCVKR